MNSQRYRAKLSLVSLVLLLLACSPAGGVARALTDVAAAEQSLSGDEQGRARPLAVQDHGEGEAAVVQPREIAQQTDLGEFAAPGRLSQQNTPTVRPVESETRRRWRRRRRSPAPPILGRGVSPREPKSFENSTAPPFNPFPVMPLPNPPTPPNSISSVDMRNDPAGSAPNNIAPPPLLPPVRTRPPSTPVNLPDPGCGGATILDPSGILDDCFDAGLLLRAQNPWPAMPAAWDVPSNEYDVTLPQTWRSQRCYVAVDWVLGARPPDRTIEISLDRVADAAYMIAERCIVQQHRTNGGLIIADSGHYDELRVAVYIASAPDDPALISLAASEQAAFAAVEAEWAKITSKTPAPVTTELGIMQTYWNAHHALMDYLFYRDVGRVYP